MMISKPLSQALNIFSSLPKYHRIGIIVLCGALISVGLGNLGEQGSDGTLAPSSSGSILASTAHAASLQQSSVLGQASAIVMEANEDLDPQVLASELPTQTAISTVEQALSPAPEQSLYVNIEESVKKGDFLETVFKRAKVDTKYMYHLLHGHPKAKSLAKIFPGHKLLFVLDSDGKLVELQHIEDALHKQVFTRTSDGYEWATVALEPEIRLVKTSGTITHSLYGAAKEAQMEDRLTMSLASIFGWDVDFALDIRENDSFTVVYEEKYLDGELLGTGDIVAAEFVNKGNSFQAVRYTDSKGDTQYYTPTGDTMRKAFLRSPIEFARISSHFNLRRKHPVLNTIRAHKGTDYAAPRGTPIKAAGDGKVVYAGRKGGYGNTLIIQHGQTYQTLYAHLQGFGKNVRKGKSVKQGQTVAYVGTTGLSTGPHLHYEFRVNGVVRNPVTVELPKADPIPKAERERFFAQTQSLVAQLMPEQATPAKTQIASQEQDEAATTTAM
ncbi:MAG TPA: peptidoglycan DD-metalloendopeptidase family protein [Marinagarivorans sp.]